MSKDDLLARVRTFRLRNPSASLADADAALWVELSKADLRMLWRDFLDRAFNRIEIVQKPGETSALVRRRDYRKIDASVTEAIKAHARDYLFQEFAARIWDTVLPNGVVLRDALGRDLVHARGWYVEIAKKVKPSERVYKKLSTRDLFNLSQRLAA